MTPLEHRAQFSRALGDGSSWMALKHLCALIRFHGRQVPTTIAVMAEEALEKIKLEIMP